MIDVPTTVKLQETFPTEVQEHHRLEDKLRQFLDWMGEELKSSDSIQESQATHEVVFDIQLDNVRYILTRSYSQTSQGQVNLSPREQEIVRLVANGHPNKTIAAVLEISPWTVSTHLRRVFAKLGVCSRAEMVARVLEADLLFNSE